MKRLCPGSLQYAVVRIDPVAMVEHLNDPTATAAARALRPKKYLVYLTSAMDLPFPSSAWFRHLVSLIGTTLRPEEPDRGITSDMVVPIHPNLDRPQGRTPIKTETPFPFGNCYHWVDNSVTVRIRRKDDLYDDSSAVKVSPQQHVAMTRLFAEDCNRINAFVEARQAEGHAGYEAWYERNACSADSDDEDNSHGCSWRQVPRRKHTPSSQDSRLSDNSGDEPRERPMNSADVRACTDASDPSRSRASMDDIYRMDIFNLARDDDAQFLPLVDLWFNLAEHLSEEAIPSPLEFREEQEAMKRIIREARERNPHVHLPPRNGALDLEFDADLSESESDQDEDAMSVASDEDFGALREDGPAVPRPGEGVSSPFSLCLDKPPCSPQHEQIRADFWTQGSSHLRIH
ncbi:hypothetical protein BD414DRAFT_495277 [Trametes punicea]|nr:hypothetical protein BD414DRAFT_495277 [Trametes punicea]